MSIAPFPLWYLLRFVSFHVSPKTLFIALIISDFPRHYFSFHNSWLLLKRHDILLWSSSWHKISLCSATSPWLCSSNSLLYGAWRLDSTTPLKIIYIQYSKKKKERIGILIRFHKMVHYTFNYLLYTHIFIYTDIYAYIMCIYKTSSCFFDSQLSPGHQKRPRRYFN